MTPSSTAGSTPGRRNTVRGRVQELFRKSRGPEQQGNGNGNEGAWSPNLAPPMPLNVNKTTAHTVNSRPVTPPNQREPSGLFDEIHVRYDGGGSNSDTLAPPRSHEEGDRRRDTYQTTFSDFLSPSTGSDAVPLAGLPKGQREFVSIPVPEVEGREESYEMSYHPSLVSEGEGSRQASGRSLTSSSAVSPVREDTPMKRPHYYDARGHMSFRVPASSPSLPSSAKANH